MSYESTKLMPIHQPNGNSHINTTFYGPRLHEYGSAYPYGNQLVEQPASPNEMSAKSIVLGGIDGITASYIIIAACSGAKLGWTYFLILGFSNILANAVSIGVSEFFSSRLHREFILAEKRRATWQYKNYRDNEVHEMIAKLERRGMSRPDAELVVGKFALYEDVFVNFLLVEELGMSLPDEDDGASLTDAFVMLMSYAMFGSLPIFVYILGIKLDDKNDNLIIISTIVTTILLIVLGSVKSTFSSSNWIYTAAETCFTTGVCAAVAYFLSYTLRTSILDDFM